MKTFLKGFFFGKKFVKKGKFFESFEKRFLEVESIKAVGYIFFWSSIQFWQKVFPNFLAEKNFRKFFTPLCNPFLQHCCNFFFRKVKKISHCAYFFSKIFKNLPVFTNFWAVKTSEIFLPHCATPFRNIVAIFFPKKLKKNMPILTCFLKKNPSENFLPHCAHFLSKFFQNFSLFLQIFGQKKTSEKFLPHCATPFCNIVAIFFPKKLKNMPNFTNFLKKNFRKVFNPLCTLFFMNFKERKYFYKFLAEKKNQNSFYPTVQPLFTTLLHFFLKICPFLPTLWKRNFRIFLPHCASFFFQNLAHFYTFFFCRKKTSEKFLPHCATLFCIIFAFFFFQTGKKHAHFYKLNELFINGIVTRPNCNWFLNKSF